VDLLCPFCGCGGLIWNNLFYLCHECRRVIEESMVEE